MSWLIALSVAFLTIFLAELGDKTQLITVSFASKYPRVPVFFGVFLAMSMITIIGVGVGAVLVSVIPLQTVKVLSGLIFVMFGIWTLIAKEGELKGGEREITSSKTHEPKISRVFSTAFIMAALAEFGDKTQLAAIALTAQYGEPVFVYLGAVIAFAVIVAIGVVLGKTLSEKVESKWIEAGSGVLFIVLGVIFILESLLF